MVEAAAAHGWIDREARDPRDAHLDPARRRRHRAHLLGGRGRPAAAASADGRVSSSRVTVAGSRLLQPFCVRDGQVDDALARARRTSASARVITSSTGGTPVSGSVGHVGHLDGRASASSGCRGSAPSPPPVPPPPEPPLLPPESSRRRSRRTRAAGVDVGVAAAAAPLPPPTAAVVARGGRERGDHAGRDGAVGHRHEVAGEVVLHDREHQVDVGLRVVVAVDRGALAADGSRGRRSRSRGRRRWPAPRRRCPAGCARRHRRRRRPRPPRWTG